MREERCGEERDGLPFDQERGESDAGGGEELREVWRGSGEVDEMTHKHQWITPLKGGVPTGEPTRCRICKAAPSPLRCVNCRKMEDESVSSHGSLGSGLHSIRLRMK